MNDRDRTPAGTALRASIRLVCLALGATACRTTYDRQGPIGTRNMWAADEIREASQRQAIVTQSTLFPYHFEPHTAQLNALGWRDLEILARHFLAHGGALSVRRGDAAEELYRARLGAVETALSASGVEPGRVRLSDAAPGGPGTTSERVLEVLERSSRELATSDASTGSGASAPTSSGQTTGAGSDR